MIDICPVGALTSKPFRYAARTWELSRRKSVSPHDSLGSNLIVQVMNDRVMRVLPLENEAVNECWITDKDRFSYEALNSDERLTAPMIKQGGEWITVDWKTALDFVAHGLKDVTAKHGGAALGALVSPHSTLEEMALTARLARGLGSDNIDFRLRQSDFRGDGQGAGIPWLGMPIADLNTLDRALVVGSFLRKDHPLVAQRLRQAAKKGTQISRLNSVAESWLLKVANTMLAPPSLLPHALAQIVVATASAAAGKEAPVALAGIEPSRRRRKPLPRVLCPGSARPFLWATPPSKARKRRSSWRWRRCSRTSRAPSLAASPRRPTAWADTLPARCRNRAALTPRRC